MAALLVGLTAAGPGETQEFATVHLIPPQQMDRGAYAFPSSGAPSLSDFATTGHLTYTPAGRQANVSVWETENVDAIVRSLIPTPLEQAGDPGSVDLGAEILAAGTAAPPTAPPSTATANMSAGPAPSRSASVAGLVPDYLYMGKKGLGLKVRW